MDVTIEDKTPFFIVKLLPTIIPPLIEDDAEGNS